MNATINGQLVEIELIPSGDAATPQALTGRELTGRELWALETLDKTLRDFPDFVTRYPNAKLVRADSMRLLTESTPGRYYLRYSSDVGVTEFWGHISRRARFDLEHGILGITGVPGTISSNTATV